MPRRDVILRRAEAEDAGAVAALVAGYARRGALLLRPERAVLETIDDWVIACHGNSLLACGSLLPYSQQLAEIRSLAVAPEAQGEGIGSEVVKALIELGGQRGFTQLFALTRAVPFFRSLGFRVRPTNPFPEKVWRDCRECPLQDACDEVAVILDLRPVGAAADWASQRLSSGGS